MGGRREPRLRGLRLLIPKYAQLEIERRFLVDAARLPPLDETTARRIEDLYIEGGRLRLRAITWLADGRREFKLGKKYERDDPVAGPIANLYLTAEEHAALAGLPGRRLTKRRSSLPPFGVDVFEGALAGLVLAEVDGLTREAVLAVQAPEWVVREVTDEPAYWGWALAGR